MGLDEGYLCYNAYHFYYCFKKNQLGFLINYPTFELY